MKSMQFHGQVSQKNMILKSLIPAKIPKQRDSEPVNLNSHTSIGGKCVEFVKTLHVKFFPFGSVKPVGSVTVK